MQRQQSLHMQRRSGDGSFLAKAMMIIRSQVPSGPAPAAVAVPVVAVPAAAVPAAAVPVAELAS